MLRRLGSLVAVLSLVGLPWVGQGEQAPEWFDWFVDHPSSPLVLPIGNPARFLVGNFNEDGHPDLVIEAYRGPFIWDLGPDYGAAEINLVMLLGDGQGGFGSPAVLFMTKGIVIAQLAADIDGDGDLDLLLLRKLRLPGYDYRTEIQMMAGDGTGKLAPPVTLFELDDLAIDVAVADLNGDEHLDFVLAHTAVGSVSVFLADGKGGFGRQATLQASTAPDHQLERLVLADFNEDGLFDLAVAGVVHDKNKNCWTRFLTVLLGNGTGGFPHRSFFLTLEPPESELPWINLVALDYDRDGHTDLITSRQEEILLLLGNGDGTFKLDDTFWLPASDPAPLVAAVTDFNQDGCWDWVITVNSSPWWGLHLLVDNCGAFSGRGFVYASRNYVPSAAVVDLDSDGRSDMVYVTGHVRMGEEVTAIWIVMNTMGSGRR